MLFCSLLAILVTTRRTERYRWLAAPGVWCDLEGCRPAEHRLTALNWCSLLADTSMLIIFQARNPRRHPLLLQKGIWGCMIQVKIWPSPEDHRWGWRTLSAGIQVPDVCKGLAVAGGPWTSAEVHQPYCSYHSVSRHYFSVRVNDCQQGGWRARYFPVEDL